MEQRVTVNLKKKKKGGRARCTFCQVLYRQKETATVKATKDKQKKKICLTSHLKPIPSHRDAFICDEIKLPAAICKNWEMRREA